jgi:asparagine synthase (glutamine-hydrolysing)
MSAIAGYFSFNHQSVDLTILKRMSNSLVLHGPDSTKSWHCGPVGLLHRSMQITPEDLFEQQPLTAAEGRFVLVADARIDNREELAATFDWSPAETRILPDSRFVLEAWLRWREHCGRYLTGSYCIAVWDNREQNLILIRDPIGTCSIHYFHNADFLAFATMPKGVFAVPGVTRELNEEKLADFLVLNHRDHRTTHYQGIYRPAPGHFLRVSAEGKVTESCYWQPDFEKRQRVCGSV